MGFESNFNSQRFSNLRGGETLSGVPASREKMKDRYLEVTFRRGKSFSAYLYLPRATEDRSVRTEEVGYGMIVDYGTNDQPLGIELNSSGPGDH